MHFNVTLNPTAQWVMQQLREAFSNDSVPRYLIFDDDSRPTQSQALGKHRLPAIFSDKVTEAIKSFGIAPKRTAFRSPWQNGVAERWVGSCKREVIDRVIVFNEDHLRRPLREYVSDYNAERVHTVIRDAGRKPVEVLRCLGVESGMTVLDVFAASGWYTEVLAHAVGANGTVYAQNTEFLLSMRDGVNDKGMTARLADDQRQLLLPHRVASALDATPCLMKESYPEGEFPRCAYRDQRTPSVWPHLRARP